MKLTNGQVKAAFDALAALCAVGNRLPVLAMVKADRNLRALGRAWEPCEAVRVKLLQEHGILKPDGTGYVFPAPGSLQRFVDGYNEIASHEYGELELEPIALADIEAGYSRDLETGEKKPVLEMDTTQFGVLITLGIVVERTKPELVKPEEAAAAS